MVVLFCLQDIPYMQTQLQAQDVMNMHKKCTNIRRMIWRSDYSILGYVFDYVGLLYARIYI
jgi:hypothetical protein